MSAQEPGLQAAAVDKLGNFEIQLFKADVVNHGTGVDGALLEFQIPEKLRGQQPVLLQAPGVAISFNVDKVNLLLPYLEQNSLFPVVMGWYGCLTCTVASQVTAADLQADYTGVAKVTVEGDTDPSNNESSATAWSAQFPHHRRLYGLHRRCLHGPHHQRPSRDQSHEHRVAWQGGAQSDHCDSDRLGESGGGVQRCQRQFQLHRYTHGWCA
ncbi:MAG: hypothetical protein R3E79_33240 [Caldilineaceae bacterium]